MARGKDRFTRYHQQQRQRARQAKPGIKDALTLHRLSGSRDRMNLEMAQASHEHIEDLLRHWKPAQTNKRILP